MHVIGVFYCPYTANKFEIFSRSFARASSLQNFSKQTRKLVAVNELSPDYREINSSRVKVGLQYPLGSNQRKGYFNNCIIYWHQINNYGLFFLLFKHLAVFGLFIISGNIYSTLSIMFTLSTITPTPPSPPHTIVLYSYIQLYGVLFYILPFTAKKYMLLRPYLR